MEPSGEDDVRLRGEIPFTNVETAKNIIPHRPAMSAAAATTRSINRLHTKSKSNYRPPPPPPTSSSSPYSHQSNLDYQRNMRPSETRSEVSVNTLRQNQLGYPSSSSHNQISSSPSIYNQNNIPSQSDVRSQENYNQPPPYYAQQKPSTPQHFYNSHRLSQNYDERNNQPNMSQHQIVNKQLNQVQYARPNSSVSSSPNMIKGMPGINAPSPLNSSPTSQYTNSNPVDRNPTVSAAYQHASNQQNSSYAHQNHQNRVNPVQNTNSPYYQQTSNQNSRVYTVNQPRPSPRNINHQYPLSNPPINSSTPIRHQSPQHFPQQNNTYHGGPNNVPTSYQQSEFQGPSNGLSGNLYPKSSVPGGPGQMHRAPPSYQSPYSTNVSNMIHNQQPYPSNRGSNEQLNAKMNQFSPPIPQSTNGGMPNGNAQFGMDGNINYNQNPNNRFYPENGNSNYPTNGYSQVQSTSKGSYALPVSIIQNYSSPNYSNEHFMNTGTNNLVGR